MQRSDTAVSPEHVARPSLLQSLVEEYGLIAMILLAAVSHGLNMFHYPLYLGDEGIYMEQAWAVLREGQLAPYTYIYDHAPAGWILIAIWEFLLPRHFLTFGMAINSGRVLMLLADVGSTALLYRIARRMTNGSHFAAIAACVAFTLSPLEIYYQRMVLLDNIMVFWVLLSLDLLLTESRRLMPIIASGLCFGIATLCKENSIFFAPVLGYLLYHKVRGSYRLRFSMAGWSVTAVMFISLYPAYALLKGEFFPAGDLIGNGVPAPHVSMISTVLWQLGRHGGSVLDAGSPFWQFFWGKWWEKDPIIIVAGAAATAVNLIIGLSNRDRHRMTLVASLLSIAFVIYLIRGSVMIDFYVVPVLPFFALNVGLLLARLAQTPPRAIGATLATLIVIAMAVGFVAQSHDEYLVDQTRLQADQLAFIRKNVPANAMVLIDDDLWVDLHQPDGNEPVYPLANSHWKIAQDPAIKDKLLHDRWQNLDYLVLSNELHSVFVENNEQLALKAYNHSRLLARFEEGGVELEVRKVIKPGPGS